MAVVDGAKAKKYFDYVDYVNYFKNSLIAAVVFVCFIMLGFGNTYVYVGLIVCLSIAAIFYMHGMLDVPSDDDIEDTFNSFGESLESKALESLNVSKEDLIRPSDWFSYISEGIRGHVWRCREGNDEVYRANTRSFLYVLYGADQLMTYQIHYNIEDEQVSVDSNSEYFYKDVVAVEMTNGMQFTLRTSGGSTSFPLKSEYDETDSERAKMVMNSIRAMIREKKA